MVLPWCVAMVLPWCVAMVLLWCCYGAAMCVLYLGWGWRAIVHTVAMVFLYRTVNCSSNCVSTVGVCIKQFNHEFKGIIINHSVATVLLWVAIVLL